MIKNAIILAQLLFLPIIITIFFLTALCFINFSCKNKITSANNFTNLHNGDLIFRCGRSTNSFAVYLADKNTEFTHVGIICIENQTPYVIHSVPSKTNLIQKETITSFLNSNNTSKFAIYRSSFKQVKLDEVVIVANSYYINKYEFDSKYDLTTNTKLYCTEMILKAFKTVGIHLKLKPKEFNYIVGNQQIILPSEFTKSPFFYKII